MKKKNKKCEQNFPYIFKEKAVEDTLSDILKTFSGKLLPI
jgi:hypothetical protein